MKKYWTMLTRDYLSHWTAVNGVREYVSNGLDGEAPLEYEFGDDFIMLTSVGITLPPTIFAMGYSHNRQDSDAVGQFGEGALVSLIPLLREGKGVKFINGEVDWNPEFVYNEDLGIEVLVINEVQNSQDTGNYSVVINNLTPEEITEIRESCIYFRDDLGEVLDGSTGSIIRGVKGKLFVGGIFVMNIPGYEMSFNFKPAHLPLNRDRKSVEGWQLASNTASLIKELLQPTEVANLIEKNAPDVQFLYAKDNVVDIADVCYENLVEKHGEDVVVCQWYDDQEKLEERGYKNVVNVSHSNYYEVVKKSPRYQQKLQELTEHLDDPVEEDDRDPITILEDWYNSFAKLPNEYDMDEFDKILDTLRDKGVDWK
jgi:hypothetical protein